MSLHVGRMTRAGLLALVLVASLGADARAAGRDLFDFRNRFLEASRPQIEAAPSVLPVESFEDAHSLQRDWQPRAAVVEQSAEHATDGEHSLKVTFTTPQSQLTYRGAGWGGFPFIRQMNFFDALCLDVFNPGDPVRLSVRMVNTFTFELKPGHNALRIATREMKRDRLMHFNLNPDGVFRAERPGGAGAVTLFVDNVRWVGPGLGPNLLAHARRFDFGPEPWCRPQFLPVAQGTGYSPRRGYGWEKPHTPAHRYDQRQSTTFTYNPVSELVGDMVQGMTSPLRVDLPPGKYRLHLVEGHVGYLDPMPSYWDLGVRVNGGPTHPLRRGARSLEEFVRFEYGRDRADWTPEQDRWTDFMACRHRVLEHDFEVTGDHASIEFVSDPPGMAQLAFMVVYPVAKANAVEPELVAMWHEIRERFNDHAFEPIPRGVAARLRVPGFREEYLDPELRRRKRETLAVTPAEDARGFVLFHREPVDPVYPDTVPAPTERTGAVTTFIPRGEIATLTLSVLALRDLRDVRPAVDDFTGPDGATIPAKQADVRVVHCTHEMSARESHGDWSWMPKPRWLVRRARVDVPADTCRRFWVNVSVPDDTPPGRYRTVATLFSEARAAGTVTLEIEVLPFRLDPVPAGVEHRVNITYPYHAIVDRELLVLLRRRPALLKEERWKRLAAEAQAAHATRVDAEFALMKRYGFRKVFMDGSYVEGVALTPEVTRGIEVVRYTQRNAAEVLSKDVVFLPLAEFTTEKIADVLRTPGRTALLERGAMSIMPLWYPDQSADVSRFQSGFFLWRSGNRATMAWGWARHLGDRYNPFCSEPGLYWGLVAPASEDWPTFNTSVVLEGVREGILDSRYLATLERLAGEHPQKPAAREARTWLDGLRGRIDPTLGHYVRRVGSGGHGGGYWTFVGTDGAWTGEDYLRERRTMTRLITALQP